MNFLVVIAVLFVVVVFVSAPLRRERRREAQASSELTELEAARDAKYRELLDAELDHRTGKLSDGDYDQLDRSLRAEAIEIMNSIDREREAGARDPGGAVDPGGAGDPDGAGDAGGAGDPDGAGDSGGAGDPDGAGDSAEARTPAE
jgi:hypothetical protein